MNYRIAHIQIYEIQPSPYNDYKSQKKTCLKELLIYYTVTVCSKFKLLADMLITELSRLRSINGDKRQHNLTQLRSPAQSHVQIVSHN